MRKMFLGWLYGKGNIIKKKWQIIFSYLFEPGMVVQGLKLRRLKY